MPESSTARRASTRRQRASETAPAVELVESSDTSETTTSDEPAPRVRRPRQPRPPKLRALMPRDVVSTRVDELAPGLVTSDGVVSSVEAFTTRAGADLGLLVRFTSGAQWVERGDAEVDVLARLTDVVSAAVLAGKNVRPSEDDEPDDEDDDESSDEQ